MTKSMFLPFRLALAPSPATNPHLLYGLAIIAIVVSAHADQFLNHGICMQFEPKRSRTICAANHRSRKKKTHHIFPTWFSSCIVFFANVLLEPLFENLLRHAIRHFSLKSHDRRIAGNRGRLVLPLSWGVHLAG